MTQGQTDSVGREAGWRPCRQSGAAKRSDEVSRPGPKRLDLACKKRSERSVDGKAWLTGVVGEQKSMM